MSNINAGSKQDRDSFVALSKSLSGSSPQEDQHKNQNQHQHQHQQFKPSIAVTNPGVVSPNGIVFMACFFIGAFCTWLLFLPSIVLLPFHSRTIIRWRRRYINILSGIFLDYSAALIQQLCGTKIFIYSSDPAALLDDQKKENVGLIICNHRTRLDWMYAGIVS